jgi:hypothetical protein
MTPARTVAALFDDRPSGLTRLDCPIPGLALYETTSPVARYGLVLWGNPPEGTVAALGEKGRRFHEVLVAEACRRVDESGLGSCFTAIPPRDPRIERGWSTLSLRDDVAVRIALVAPTAPHLWHELECIAGKELPGDGLILRGSLRRKRLQGA